MRKHLAELFRRLRSQFGRAILSRTLIYLAAAFGPHMPAIAQVQQAWVAYYPSNQFGTAEAYAMAVDDAGNVYITGSATVKYDPNGQQLWSTNGGSALALDAAGNVYVARGAATIKYDSNGNQLWEARYQPSFAAGASAVSIAVDNSGNVIVSGSLIFGDDCSGPLGGDYLTIKYDPSGNEVWAVRYDGPIQSKDHATAMVVDGAGNVYVTGYSFSQVVGTEGCLRGISNYATVKYNADGRQLWAARYSAVGPSNFEASSDIANALALDSAGNVYVTGNSGICTRNIFGSPDCAYDYATVKYDSDGNQLWAARYTGPYHDLDVATAISIDSQGNVCVTGWSTLPVIGDGGCCDVGEDFVTIKYDRHGRELWTGRYGSPHHTKTLAAIATDAMDNVYVTGRSRSDTGSGYDYATIKYAPSGNQLWAARFSVAGFSGSWPLPFAVAVDNSNNVYVAGDRRIAKYVQNTVPGSPNITSQPENQTVTEGESVTFVVAASGAEPLSYQWRMFGTNIPGATNATLSFSFVQQNQAGDYSVEVSNSAGVVVSPVRLVVSPRLHLEWLATYGAEISPTDGVAAMAVDSAGNVYVTGYVVTAANGDGDYATVKYDPHGRQLWAVRYNGNSNDSARAIAVDGSGNVYVTGYSRGVSTGEDYATVKYGPQGNRLWVRRYSSSGSRNDRPPFNGLALDTTGNVYITGSAGTIKYDGNGSQRWVATNVVGDALVVDGTGNVFVTGTISPPARVTVKYDSNGNQVWLSRSTNYGYASGIALDGLGNVYVTGDSALVKYDSSGNKLWSAQYVESDPDFLEVWNGAAVDSAGNAYVAGYGNGILTFKYAANGHLLWVARYVGPAEIEDAPWAIAVDDRGNVYVSGYITAYAPVGIGLQYDWVTLKYDSAGHQLAAQRLGDPNDAQAYALALDTAGNIYVAGFGFADGFVTAKYAQHPIPTRLEIATTPTNTAIQITLTGEAQRRYEIQASINLLTWRALTNFVSATGTTQFTDPAAPNFSRFYRAVTP